MRNNIEESLNLLKQLESRLKLQTTSRQTEQSQTHIKTEPHIYEPLSINLHAYHRNQIKDDKKKQQNSNHNMSYSELYEENHKLKKYIGRLIKMNEYLKNQLIKGQKYEKKYGSMHQMSPELQKLKLEINYLQEANKQKQFEIEMHREHIKKHKRTISCQQQSAFRSHNHHSLLQSRKRYDSKIKGVCLKFSNKKMPTTKTNTNQKSSQKKSVKTNSHCRLCY